MLFHACASFFRRACAAILHTLSGLWGRVWETKSIPKWNPQEEFTSDEENNGFQGFFADGTRLFIPLFELVEILISTKGVDKVDTLIRGLYQNQKNRWKVLNLQPASSFQSTNRNFCVV